MKHFQNIEFHGFQNFFENMCVFIVKCVKIQFFHNFDLQSVDVFKVIKLLNHLLSQNSETSLESLLKHSKSVRRKMIHCVFNESHQNFEILI